MLELTCGINPSDAKAQEHISSSGVQNTQDDREAHHGECGCRCKMEGALLEVVGGETEAKNGNECTNVYRRGVVLDLKARIPQ